MCVCVWVWVCVCVFGGVCVCVGVCVCSGVRIASPADVYKQVLGSLVYVEHLVPEQAQAGGALQGQLPQAESRRVAAQHRVAQDEPNCGDAER